MFCVGRLPTILFLEFDSQILKKLGHCFLCLLLSCNLDLLSSHTFVLVTLLSAYYSAQYSCKCLGSVFRFLLGSVWVECIFDQVCCGMM